MKLLHVVAEGQRARLFLAVSALAGVGLIAGLLRNPDAAWPALLAITLAGLGATIGAAALLDIHRLSGGAWGKAGRRALTDCAKCAPIFAVPLVACSFGLRHIYPWAAASGVVKLDAGNAIWLTPAFFLTRGAVIIAFWIAWSWMARRPGRTKLQAALCLIGYALTASFAGADWLMSRTPNWGSSAFGAMFAIQQIASAFACLAIAVPFDAPQSVVSDRAQLLLAALLGLAYLHFMQYLVIWSGNLPDRVDYYVARDTRRAICLLSVSALCGLVLPFSVLIDGHWRRSSRAVGVVGCLALFGLTLLWFWQVTPSAGAAFALWAGVAAIASGGACVGFLNSSHSFVLTEASISLQTDPLSPEKPSQNVAAPPPLLRLTIKNPYRDINGDDFLGGVASSNVAVKPLAFIAIGLACTIMATLIAVSLAFRLSGSSFSGYTAAAIPQLPQPQLQIAPDADLASFNSAQLARLQNNAMPIDQAMQAIVGRGSNAYDAWLSSSPPPTGRLP